MNEPSFLVCDTTGPARIIRLHRPERRNALSAVLLQELSAELERADADPEVRGVVLTGSGEVFSAGVDLQEALEADTASSAMRYLSALRRVATDVEQLTKPVVAAIRGFCMTGGLELALACDYRIASPDATFAITSARIGSVPGMGGTQRLPRVVGAAHAKDMIMRARTLGAEEALSLGLVQQVRPGDTVVGSAVDWVIECAQQAPLSVWFAKLAVNEGAEMSLRSSLHLEAALSALAFGTEDKREGMSAVLEKRKPQFKGR